MTEIVSYSAANGVATIQLDDGKRNAMSPELIRQLYAAFDRAEADRALVILTGREQVFSAGFDLKLMKGAPLDALRMLGAGFSLTARVMAYPYPVIAACNGHALAMGVFLMFSADYVIGARGEFRISANEAAIGLTMPRSRRVSSMSWPTPRCSCRAPENWQPSSASSTCQRTPAANDVRHAGSHTIARCSGRPWPSSARGDHGWAQVKLEAAFMSPSP